MKTFEKRPLRRLVPAVSLALALAASLPAQAAQDAETDAAKAIANAAELSASAQSEMAAIQADKAARTPAQRKISSSLLYLSSAKRTALFPAAATAGVQSLLQPQKDSRYLVDIATRSMKTTIAAVEAARGTVVHVGNEGLSVRALLPLASLERVAASPDVTAVRPAARAKLNRTLFTRQFQAALDAVPDGGSVISQGDAAHRAEDARNIYGVNGAGVKVGVLSDSDDFKEAAIASGDLPADTETLPGQSGRPGSGEGTAMMEIVHDLAPGAQIYFATAFNSPDSFADNIRALRAAGCNIIVDDVIYYVESPFQDDVIAKAVADVVADGAWYFSSAGNDGNFDNGTSGVWEGDFKKSKTVVPLLAGDGDIHDFATGVVSNRVEASSGPLYLHWSDPGTLDGGQSANDYDLYVLDGNLTHILVASTDIQSGDGFPFEFIDATIPVDARVVIVKKTGSENRALRLELSRGELALATAGAVYGHNSAPGAYAVGAADAANAGGGAFSGGATNPIETFSSDGNRRLFYDANGVPFKPGKPLTFKGGGLVTRAKPDLTAADGVSTTLPGTSGLNPFFGTSAAAPHAGAIAALLKQAKPTLTGPQLRAAFTKAALDIEGAGRDRDSGVGIIDAQLALAAIKAKPQPTLLVTGISTTQLAGDGDAFVEPGEQFSLTTQLTNIGGAAPVALHGVLTTGVPGISVDQAASTFPSIAPSGGTGTNDTPFAFTLAPSATCGVPADFTLTASYTGSTTSPATLDFSVPVGSVDPNAVTTTYAGGRVAIPDGNATGVNVPLAVAGLGRIADLKFKLEGATCTAAAGSTTVGLDHSWVGDLTLTLTSPQGTTVTLLNRPGGINNSGNNFCKTVLDDAGVNSIQNIPVAGAPWQGTFKPASPLSAFDGEDPNGTWILHATDSVSIDTGSVRVFSLIINGFVCN